jgi:hypothetical protein
MCDVRRFLAACLLAGSFSPFAGAADPPFSPVVVTRDSLSLNCSPRDVAEVVLRFERALDAGDGNALDRVFARKPAFQWYSIDGTTIRERSRLVPFLLAARSRGVRIRLVAVDVGNSWVPHAVGLGVTLDDAHGKAEIDCRSRRIYVWSVSSDTAASPCPQTAQRNALRTLVACSRTGRKPLAQELSRDFAVVDTGLRYPRSCGPSAVKRRIAAALRAFDLAGASAFARNFTRGANMQPYTNTRPPVNLRGRSQIADFGARRAAHGDGWTAARLLPPAGGAGARGAIYGLTLRVSSPSGGGENGVKLVIDCRSGLIARWVGPALAEPR